MTKLVGRPAFERGLWAVRSIRRLPHAVLSFLLCLSCSTTAAWAQAVDLELVLAVDASSSVSSEEFDLQMHGLAEAFRDPRVASAIQAGGDLGIAVAMVQWADNRRQFLAVDWTAIRDSAAAEGFADVIDRTPRFVVGGGTAIGGAIQFSVRELQRNSFQGRRQVIDLSGDGRANQGAQPADVRDRAVAAGVTINGLAILNEDPNIDTYYLYHVIGGTGAFVVTATSYEDFAAAMLEKLIREIAGVPVAGLPPASDRVQIAAAPGGPADGGELEPCCYDSLGGSADQAAGR